MPIYRTHSDRGLWKKYRSEQPQHFHKACYLENSKEKPQVSQPAVMNYYDSTFCNKLKTKNMSNSLKFDAMNPLSFDIDIRHTLILNEVSQCPVLYYCKISAKEFRFRPYFAAKYAV